MSKKQTTVLMAAVIAIATILAAGLVAFPGSIQEAQANPCSINVGGDGADTVTSTGEQNCEFIGPTDFDE